jgi:hypothetical protein
MLPTQNTEVEVLSLCSYITTFYTRSMCLEHLYDLTLKSCYRHHISVCTFILRFVCIEFTRFLVRYIRSIRHIRGSVHVPRFTDSLRTREITILKISAIIRTEVRSELPNLLLETSTLMFNIQYEAMSSISAFSSNAGFLQEQTAQRVHVGT